MRESLRGMARLAAGTRRSGKRYGEASVVRGFWSSRIDGGSIGNHSLFNGTPIALPQSYSAERAPIFAKWRVMRASERRIERYTDVNDARYASPTVTRSASLPFDGFRNICLTTLPLFFQNRIPSGGSSLAQSPRYMTLFAIGESSEKQRTYPGYILALSLSAHSRVQRRYRDRERLEGPDRVFGRIPKNSNAPPLLDGSKRLDRGT